MLCLGYTYTNKRTSTYCFPVFFHRRRINIAGNGDWYFLLMGGFFLVQSFMNAAYTYSYLQQLKLYIIKR